jgi:hypothetical protein
MGRIPALLTATGVMLLLLAGLTLKGRDTGTLVPPPEKVAESLVRQLATGRFNQTRQFLSRDARATIDAGRLSACFHDVEVVTGPVSTVHGESALEAGDTADARVVVSGRLRSVVLFFHLVRERGLWMVSELPAIASVEL